MKTLQALCIQRLNSRKDQSYKYHYVNQDIKQPVLIGYLPLPYPSVLLDISLPEDCISEISVNTGDALAETLQVNLFFLFSHEIIPKLGYGYSVIVMLLLELQCCDESLYLCFHPVLFLDPGRGQ